jgi:hypothetical protein
MTLFSALMKKGVVVVGANSQPLLTCFKNQIFQQLLHFIVAAENISNVTFFFPKNNSQSLVSFFPKKKRVLKWAV